MFDSEDGDEPPMLVPVASPHVSAPLDYQSSEEPQSSNSGSGENGTRAGKRTTGGGIRREGGGEDRLTVEFASV